MRRYNSTEAVQRMNELGRKGDDFLFVIDFEAKHCIVEKLSDISAEECLYDFPCINNLLNDVPLSDVSVEVSISESSLTSYRKQFEFVQKAILRGDSFLANLTNRLPICLNCGLKEVFWAASAPYKLFLPHEFVCFSPESFVRIDGNTISSFPMKGTIDASLPNAVEILLNNEKEKAEHATIVDLIRNDLSRIASNVAVEKYRYVERINTSRGGLIQTSSAISGQLTCDYEQRLGSMLFQLLPAGSITGAPKKRTVEILQQAESEPRGYYTGVMGVYSSGRLDSAVMIRCIEEDTDSNFFYHAGGGITSQSVALSEYNEMIQKVYVPTL